MCKGHVTNKVLRHDLKVSGQNMNRIATQVTHTNKAQVRKALGVPKK